MLGSAASGGGAAASPAKDEIGAQNAINLRSDNQLPMFKETPQLERFAMWGDQMAQPPSQQFTLQLVNEKSFKDMLEKASEFNGKLIGEERKRAAGGGDDLEVEDDEELRQDNALIAVEDNGEARLYLTEDGRVYCSGRSDYGLLGRGDESVKEEVDYEAQTRNIFRVPIPEQVVDIKMGRKHALALTAMGEVYAWGSNNAGQVGVERSRLQSQE